MPSAMNSGSPPIPKPKSALPSHLLRESSPLHMAASAREQEIIAASIRSSFLASTAVGLDSTAETQSRRIGISDTNPGAASDNSDGVR
jgi:hypothetical protein